MSRGRYFVVAVVVVVIVVVFVLASGVRMSSNASAIMART